MRIDHIEIQNFRCFENLQLDLHPQFNVLIGENGSGKTAILEALAVAAGTYILGAGGMYEPRRIEENDIRLVKRRVGGQTAFEQQAPVSVSARGQFDGRQVEWARSLTQPDWRSFVTNLSPHLALDRPLDPLDEHLDEMERQVRAGKLVTLPVIAYYGADRLRSPSDAAEASASLTQRELSRFEGYRDAFTAHTRARELARWIEYQDRVNYQEKQEPLVYRAVLNAMRDMVESAEDVLFHAKRLEVVVEFKNDEAHPFGQLSDGQRAMLALAGDIAMRMARLNPQFDSDVLKETPGVVLIDELDLHLHPRWQRHVAADLRRTFPKVQFVTTTHSPQIISEVQPECVTVLQWDGERVNAHKAHQTYGLDSNGVLQRLMDDPGRPVAAREKIDQVDDAIEDGDLDQAREQVKQLRWMLHGDDPEVARLEASIYNLEALALDAVD